MQNIEELVQQLLHTNINNNDIGFVNIATPTLNKEKETTIDKKKKQQKDGGSKFNTVKIPISMALLDQLSSLKSLSANLPSSPTIPSGNSSNSSNLNSPQSATSANANAPSSGTSASNDASSSGTASTVTSASILLEYENRINEIKETIEKILNKQIPDYKSGDDIVLFNFPSTTTSDSIVNDILNSYDGDLQEEQANYDFELEGGSHHSNSIFGPSPSGRNNNTSSNSRGDGDGYTSYRLHWTSIIVKLHQAILSSALYQNLLKKIYNVNASSQFTSSQSLVESIKDPKVKLNSSLSSNSLVAKPLSSSCDNNDIGGDTENNSNNNSNSNISANVANGSVAKSKIGELQSSEVHQSTKSTPTTPPSFSPSTRSANGQSADQDAQPSSITSESSGSGKDKTSPNLGKSLLSNVINGGNGVGSGSAGSNSSMNKGSTSSSSSFSLSALMAGNSRDAPPALKDLAERSAKYDQQGGKGTNVNPLHQMVQQQQQQPIIGGGYQQPYNPNINKLPSSYETDPVLLPDGSEFSNARPGTSSNSSVPIFVSGSIGNNNPPAPSQPGSYTSNPIPMNIPTSSLFSPPSSNPLSTSFGAGPRSFGGGNTFLSTSPYEIQQQQSSGVPPTRYNESFFSTSASSQQSNGIQIPQSSQQQQQQQTGSMMSVSPSPSSLSNSGGFNRMMQMNNNNNVRDFQPIEINPISTSLLSSSSSSSLVQPINIPSSNNVPISSGPSSYPSNPSSMLFSSSPNGAPINNNVNIQQQPQQQVPIAQQIQPQQSMPAIGTMVPASSSFKATSSNNLPTTSTTSAASLSTSSTSPTTVITTPTSGVSTGGDNSNSATANANLQSSKTNLDKTVKQLSQPIAGFSDHSFPEWLDISIYWRKEDDESTTDDQIEFSKSNVGINLEIKQILLCEQSSGRLDHYLESKLITLIHNQLVNVIQSKTSNWVEPIYNYWSKSLNIEYHNQIANKFQSFINEFNSHIWDNKKYQAFTNRIVNLRRQFPPSQSAVAVPLAPVKKVATTTTTTGTVTRTVIPSSYQPTQTVTAKGLPIPIQKNSPEEEVEIMKIFKQIELDIVYLVSSVQHLCSLKYLEKLLIGTMGHTSADIRQSSVRLLNVIYDSHTWQFEEPLKPVIRVIGDAFRVEIELEKPLPDDVLKRIFIATVQPPTQRLTNLFKQSTSNSSGGTKRQRTQSSSQSTSSNSTIFCKHKPKSDGNKLYIDLPSFYRAGYYDWRIVELTSDGIYLPFDDQTYKLKSSTNTVNSAAVSTTSTTTATTTPIIESAYENIQGRFIVHPKLREEIMHEVWIDLIDSVWDPYRGEMTKRGKIQNLIDSLDQYHQDGITTLYVMGVLEKLSSNQPLCPTDRDLANRSLGGDPMFNELMKRAKQLGIKIVIDSTTRLSSKAAHRKYKGVVCHTLDNNGQLSRLEGTDSLEFTWNDCVSMNMRKQSVWEMFVQETLLWGERGVDGIRIDSAHTCPLLFRSNLDEMYRLDSDDLPHYTNQQIFEGEIVMKPSEEGKNFGYWGTTPPSPKHSTPFYPNPIFIKMTREVWNRFPQFVFMAEVYWDRELHSIISGLVPYSSAIPKALASVFDKGISKDGIVFDLRQRQSVKALYDYYEMRTSTYPQNSIILYPSSTHHSPYPLQIYNAGAWAAVDMMYFLPEIPITYIGEQNGWYYHVDIHTSRVKVGMSATPYQLQYPQIRGHYAHRVALRKSHALLRRGGMIPLLCYHQHGWHDRVFGFARFSGNEVAIIAINFDNTDTEFYVDCSPLAKICSEDTIYRMVDLINPSNPPQYLSLKELLYEKHFVVVPGFSSICWGIYHQVGSPAAMRVLYEHSMTRLKQLLADDVDPSNNLIYSLIKNSLVSIEEFGKTLENILSNLSGNTEKTFSSFVQSVLYTLTKTFDGHTILLYLDVLSKKSTQFPKIPKICREILAHNTLGPIVFVTPEIGRFSTVGGVGVMLDELTRSLQVLGLEIHIISPYYNYGKGGRTGYLEKEEGIGWKRNVLTYVGPDRVEVGVHEGMDKGIHLHFLHHFEYFPTPYNSGSSIHQLKTIVLFAKASLELLCQLRILPSVIVTNDWFTGLVPGYAKSGAFGTTFNGTTFFHLVHNLEEAYQGRIYPDGGDDLNWIHHLHRDLIVDPYSHQLCLNASRCALLTCNNWGTVSKSYLYDLLRTSHLANLLHRFPDAFAHSNGIRVKERKLAMRAVSSDHWSAKAELQKKYFNLVDKSIPVFSFVGRIVLQKGVHLILNAVRELITHYQGRIQILIGGMANMKDPYASSCAWSMQALCKQYPQSFWADPDSFFSDGPLVNLGSDFGLMPSLFEPSGVVQQEYFVAGTPVIAFKTGGLKDTVFEYSTTTEIGNGFTFEAHKHTDYVQAVHRAVAIFNNVHHYNKIREMSEQSVLDMSVVAEAWAKEFSRLRKSIFSANTSTTSTANQITQ